MSATKTFSNETSERYALALFELSDENSEVDNIENTSDNDDEDNDIGNELSEDSNNE